MDLVDVHAEVPVGESDALGLSGRPRGVDETGEVARRAFVEPRPVGGLVERLVTEVVDVREGVHVVPFGRDRPIDLVDDDDEREVEVVLDFEHAVE